MKSPRFRLAFLCVENSCRSQIAEAFARSIGGESVDAWSAGSRPSGLVNPKAVASLLRRGVDLSSHRSKSIEDLPGVFDVAVTMGCGDACPVTLAKRRVDWDIPDPKHMDDAAFDAVRDSIETKVRELLEELP